MFESVVEQDLRLAVNDGLDELVRRGVNTAGTAGPFGLQLRIWKNAGTAVLDGTAFGRLYVAPVELRAFEADGGLTNKQNVRMETNAGFSVERTDAGLRIL
jgi:hypothetical protein